MRENLFDVEFVRNRGTPERNLVSAILQRAWADLDNSCKFIQADAYKWITSEDQGKPWTFFWACELLNINPIESRKLFFNHAFIHRHQKLRLDRYKRKEI